MLLLLLLLQGLRSRGGIIYNIWRAADASSTLDVRRLLPGSNSGQEARLPPLWKAAPAVPLEGHSQQQCSDKAAGNTLSRAFIYSTQQP